VFDDQKSFEDAIQKARTESGEKRLRRKALARRMAELHSFDARAREILRVAEGTHHRKNSIVAV
ncbi:MAG: hypothetical protein GTN64_08615, partial [Candidatus Latescibacteria bacterium]|nr:hypothetical protein [Candidatus Latescibacterota bacterium]NIO78661.1 hypothetical protein [Candidatus Latescibacterota bacterium]